MPNLIPPWLGLLTTSTNQLIITWPTNSVGWTLLFNPDLTSTNWATVSPPTTIIGTNYEVILTSTNRAGFFRLWHP